MGNLRERCLRNRHDPQGDSVVSTSAIRIIGTGSFVPPTCIGNDELRASCPDVDPQWVQHKLGIRYRHLVGLGQATSDLAVQAALLAIDDAKMDPYAIDLLVVATATPDRQAPSTACIVQNKLGLKNFPAFDVGAVCSGFLFALVIGAQFIETGAANYALIIGADVFSKITNWRRRDSVFFGDGAGAVVIEKSPEHPRAFISNICSHGQGLDFFTVYSDHTTFSMNPSAVARAALESVPQNIARVLKASGKLASDVDIVIPHQPSITLLREIALSSGIDFTKFQTNMDRYANTAGATVPIALDECHRSGKLTPGMSILFAVAGSGMTSGAALYQWH